MGFWFKGPSSLAAVRLESKSNYGAKMVQGNKKNAVTLGAVRLVD